MKRPRITRRELQLAAALIVAGVASNFLPYILFNGMGLFNGAGDTPSWPVIVTTNAIGLLGDALLGAGIGALFHRMRMGAVLGILVLNLVLPMSVIVGIFIARWLGL